MPATAPAARFRPPPARPMLPQQPISRPPAMIARDFRRIEKGTLLGFFSLDLSSGLSIREVPYHHKNDRYWIQLPSRPQLNTDGQQRVDPTSGKKLYSPIIEIRDPARRANFQRGALSALDQLFRERPA